MILSFARHFDRRTTGPSPDIQRFRRTFHVGRKRKPSQDIFNTQTENWISSPDILLNLSLRRTFENFARHVRRISRTLVTRLWQTVVFEVTQILLGVFTSSHLGRRRVTGQWLTYQLSYCQTKIFGENLPLRRTCSDLNLSLKKGTLFWEFLNTDVNTYKVVPPGPTRDSYQRGVYTYSVDCNWLYFKTCRL